MYNYFNNTFWEKVKAYGIKKMKKHVKILRVRREQMKPSSNRISSKTKKSKQLQEKDNNNKLSEERLKIATKLQKEKRKDIKLYEERIKDYNSDLMSKAMRTLVIKSSNGTLNEEQVDQIALHMKHNRKLFLDRGGRNGSAKKKGPLSNLDRVFCPRKPCSPKIKIKKGLYRSWTTLFVPENRVLQKKFSAEFGPRFLSQKTVFSRKVFAKLRLLFWLRK